MIRASTKVWGAESALRNHPALGVIASIRQFATANSAAGVMMSEHSSIQGFVGEAPVKRSVRKRSLILAAAMHHFATHGYEAARVGDMASQLGIAKGSVFQHFGSKDGLFFESYKSALRALPALPERPGRSEGGTGFSRSCDTVYRCRSSSGNRIGCPIASCCWAITAQTSA